MPLSLAAAAAASTDDLQRGIIETFVQESPVLDRIPLLTINGNAYAYDQEQSLPGVAFRAVNAAYPESTGTIVRSFERLAILGGDADVDRFIVQTRGNLHDQRALQTRMKVKSASYAYSNAFINGSADGTVGQDDETVGFDGLKARLTGDQVIDAEGRGLINVTDEAAVHEFFDLLDEAVAAVPGVSGGNGAVYTNRRLISKIVSAGRRIGGIDWIKEDMTGKRVVSWNGIPFLDLGDTGPLSKSGKADHLAHADIIPLEGGTDPETDPRTTDLYVVKFGQNEADGGVTGLTNGGVQVRDLGEIDSKPVFRTRIEFYCGLATFGGQAAARVTGVTV